MTDRLSVDTAARETPERIAFIDGARSLDFNTLRRECALRVGCLAARGVSSGDRVVVQGANDLSTVLAILAVIERGAVVVPVHPRLTERERTEIERDCGAVLTLGSDALRAFDEQSRNAFEIAVFTPCEDSQPMAIVYTSGTTGTPKGAVLTRRAFRASARASAENLGWREDDRWLLCLPVCHIGGLSIITRCLIARRTVVLLARYHPEAVDDAVVSHGCTIVSLVPTMLARSLDREKTELGRPRAVLLGGAAAPQKLLRHAIDRGVRVMATYGLTEACSQVATWQAQAEGEAPTVQRGVGRAVSGVDLRVSNVGRDDVGQIEIRGESVSEGYWNKPRRESDWFDTGDLGRLDPDGVLHISARRTDLIVTGGENVYPVEVEAALGEHRDVVAVMVFGVEDEAWGQTVNAAVVLAEGVKDCPRWREELRLFASERLSGFKIPKALAVVDEIPLLANGKPDRTAARARFSAMLTPLKTPRG